jgi:hypothetical protein
VQRSGSAGGSRGGCFFSPALQVLARATNRVPAARIEVERCSCGRARDPSGRGRWLLTRPLRRPLPPRPQPRRLPEGRATEGDRQVPWPAGHSSPPLPTRFVPLAFFWFVCLLPPIQIQFDVAPVQIQFDVAPKPNPILPESIAGCDCASCGQAQRGRLLVAVTVVDLKHR